MRPALVALAVADATTAAAANSPKAMKFEFTADVTEQTLKITAIAL